MDNNNQCNQSRPVSFRNKTKHSQAPLYGATAALPVGAVFLCALLEFISRIEFN